MLASDDNYWIKHCNKRFVCVEVLRPSQPNGVMSSAVSLPNHTFTGQALSSKRLTSIVHILSPETDRQLPFLNQRKGEKDRRKYFMINLHERMLPTSAGVEPATSWSPVGRASNWATEAGPIKDYLYLQNVLLY